MRHPQVIKKFHDNARKASEAAKKFPGQHNGEGDAVRHVYWSALNTLSENANLAKEFGDAHEQNPGQDIAEKNMDLFNNSIGYQLGDLAKQNKWSEERLFKEIIKYKNDETMYNYITLNLYAYLASWGMLRNSFLMQKDYFFH